MEGIDKRRTLRVVIRQAFLDSSGNDKISMYFVKPTSASVFPESPSGTTQRTEHRLSRVGSNRVVRSARLGLEAHLVIWCEHSAADVFVLTLGEAKPGSSRRARIDL